MVKLDDFLPAKEGFCAKINDEYFLQCANVRYPSGQTPLHDTKSHLRAEFEKQRVFRATRGGRIVDVACRPCFGDVLQHRAEGMSFMENHEPPIECDPGRLPFVFVSRSTNAFQ